MKWLKKLRSDYEDYFMIILLIVIATVLIVHIVLRYVFKGGLVWADEVAKLALVISTFLGIAYNTKHENFSRMYSLRAVMPAKLDRSLEILVDILMLTACAAFGWATWQNVLNFRKANQVTPVLEWPWAVIYTILVVCYADAVFRLAQKTIRDIKKLKMAFSASETAKQKEEKEEKAS